MGSRWLLALLALLVGCGGRSGEPAASPDAIAGRADAGQPGLDGALTRDAGQPDALGPSPLAPRVENTTCALPALAPSPLAFELAYPALPRFERPLWLGQAPDGSDRMYVVEQGGRIRVFDDRADAAQATLFLELPVSREGNEEGLLGLAFHPRYAENGRLYVYYSAARPRRGVIAELQRDPADPRRALPGSERVILEVPQPYGNHNGGDLHFHEGLLYLALGDGGAGGDPEGNGQNPQTLLGSMLRIDVDRSERGLPYGLPPDNPFCAGGPVCASDGRGRTEIWATGLRNMWRFSFDRVTGELWGGDVGQDTWEEIDLVEAGGNYGWNDREGFRCFQGGADCPEHTPPIYAYDRFQGISVTGGYVYRGPRLPALWGAYVFGDFGSGRIWALRRQAAAEPDVGLLVETEQQISSFGEAADGRLFFTSFDGRVYRLRRRDRASPPPRPAILSQTGCFRDVAAHQVAPGVVPFWPRLPRWRSREGTVERFVALPEGGQIRYRAEGAFEVPAGTVLLETIASGGRRVETRLLVRRASGWRGYLYRWDEDQGDATLIEGPRAQCEQCHTAAAGGALGLTARQLNHPVRYSIGGSEPPSPYPQLTALAGAGYLEGLTAPPPPWPLPADDAGPPADRARALLHVSCAGCHRPGAPGNSHLDLRAATPLSETGACEIAPRRGTMGVEGAAIITPGAASRSVLWLRMRDAAGSLDRMPPFEGRPDDASLALIQRWIDALEGCQ